MPARTADTQPDLRALVKPRRARCTTPETQSRPESPCLTLRSSWAAGLHELSKSRRRTPSTPQTLGSSRPCPRGKCGTSSRSHWQTRSLGTACKSCRYSRPDSQARTADTQPDLRAPKPRRAHLARQLRLRVAPPESPCLTLGARWTAASVSSPNSPRRTPSKPQTLGSPLCPRCKSARSSRGLVGKPVTGNSLQESCPSGLDVTRNTWKACHPAPTGKPFRHARHPEGSDKPITLSVLRNQYTPYRLSPLATCHTDLHQS